MYKCPDCKETLSTIVEESNVLWSCPNDHGRAVTFAALSKVVGPQFSKGLWRKIRHSDFPSTRFCHDCQKAMSRIKTADHGIELDVCELCTFVWLEYGEIEKSPVERREAALEDVNHEGWDEVWKFVPDLFALPEEMNKSVLGLVPYATWTVCIGVLLLSSIAFFNGRLLDLFALVPSDFRVANFISSFFVHANFMHLFGNLYFLWLFGGNVEHFVGHTRFALLLLISTVCGSLLYAFMHLSSSAPLVGASGGITGIAVFYALMLPKARLSLIGRGGWLPIPVWLLLFVWISLNIVGIIWGGRIAYLAHLGGAIAGALYWLWSKWRDQNAD